MAESGLGCAAIMRGQSIAGFGGMSAVGQSRPAGLRPGAGSHPAAPAALRARFGLEAVGRSAPPKGTDYDQTISTGFLVCCLILGFRNMDQISAVIGLQSLIDFSDRSTVEPIWVPCPPQEGNWWDEQGFKEAHL